MKKQYGKAPKFSGQEKDWSDWQWRFLSWASIMRVSGLLESSVTHPGSLATADQASGVARKSQLVFHTLINVLEGKALAMLRNIERGNGFLARRKLHEFYAPAVAGRFMSVLSGLMSIQFRNTDSFLQDLENWETLVTRYETESREKLSEAVRAAVLLKGLNAKLQEVVRMSGVNVGDYSEMTVLLKRYVRSGQRSDTHGSLVSSRGHRDDSMDIGFVKGKSKGKGKSSAPKRSGKGSKTGKATDRSRTPETRTCHKCGRPGHLARDCYSKTMLDGKVRIWFGKLESEHEEQGFFPSIEPKGQREA